MKTTLTQLLIDALFAVMIFIQITGCTTTYQRALSEYLNDPSRYRLYVPEREQVTTNAQIPLLSVNHFPHSAEVTVDWSNGFQETFDLVLSTAGIRSTAGKGKHYAVLAVELNPDQKSNDVTLEVASLGKELSPGLGSNIRKNATGEPGFPPFIGGALGPGVVALALLLLPFIIYKYFTRVTERPFAGCCFVWAVNVETGETQDWAGSSPEGPKVVFSSSNPRTTPNQEELPGLN